MSQPSRTTQSLSSPSRRPSLFIVESPTKAKTIQKYFGDTFIVCATVGHIADIATADNAVDLANDFAVTYELTPAGQKTISELRKEMKKCDEIILATDADREGELIAALVVEFLRPTIPVKRIDVLSITKPAIEDALQHSREIDQNLVEAARTRRVLDRLFGYQVTDIARKKVRGNTTAGRVQSPALRLIVEREYERIAFTSASYWDVVIGLDASPAFKATLTQVSNASTNNEMLTVATGKHFDDQGQFNANTKEVVVVDQITAERIAACLSQPSVVVEVRDVASTPAKRNPQPPFVMSSLLQAAGNRIGMSAAEVRSAAQELFGKSHITYPRTDNPVHTPSSRKEIRAQIAKVFGADKVAPFERYASSKGKHTQGAHEAIRPTRLDVRKLAGVTPRQQALYDLIWQRTMASQMIEATGTTLTVTLFADVSTDKCAFTATGTTYSEPGFLAVYAAVGNDGEEGDDASAIFPPLSIGDDVPVSSAEAKEHRTLPPARFTEASLVRELERLGIGRPSTYTAIIEKLHDRYVWSKQGDRALIPTVTAFAVHRLLTTWFADLIDYEFTNQLENNLDQIADGAALRLSLLNDFFFGTPDVVGLQTLVSDAADNTIWNEMFALELGAHPESGELMVVRPGRWWQKTKTFSPYIECGEVQKSIPDHMAFDTLSPTDVAMLLTLPRVLGQHPDSGADVVAQLGPYGPYVKCGDETRSLLKDGALFTISLEEALAVLATPKKARSEKKWTSRKRTSRKKK
jgi:DNA topoisomerase I